MGLVLAHAKPQKKSEILKEQNLSQQMDGKEALRRVLVRKGLVSNEEVLEEVKAVRREMEEKG